MKHFFLMVALVSLAPAVSGSRGFTVPTVLHAQVSFEQTVQELKDPDSRVRLRAVRMLREASYHEGAVPIASVLVDPDDGVQLEAIGAELNIFLTRKIESRRGAESAFLAGPFVLGSLPVPVEVLIPLSTAAHDDNPHVALEALYAFGTLAGEVRGKPRRALLGVSGPELVPMLGARNKELRLAAVRVLGRLFAQQSLDDPIAPVIGDPLVAALNDESSEVRLAAVEALGAMRYERAIEALTDLFKFQLRGAIAEGALVALAHIAHASSAPLFVEQLRSKDAALRVASIEGLTRIGDRAATDKIQSALVGERSEAVLLSARFASVMLSGGSVDPITSSRSRHASRGSSHARFWIPTRASAATSPTRSACRPIRPPSGWSNR
jgi:HEAT repeat protein